MCHVFSILLGLSGHPLLSLFWCVHHPPDCSVTMMIYIMGKYTMAMTYGKDMFIVGDLNCNMLKDNQDTKVLKDLCSSLN